MNGKTNGKDSVRIRAAAKKNSKVVKNQKTGTYVNVLGDEDGYYKIRIGKTEGYILKEFLTLVYDNTQTQKYHIYDEESERYMKKIEEEASKGE